MALYRKDQILCFRLCNRNIASVPQCKDTCLALLVELVRPKHIGSWANNQNPSPPPPNWDFLEIYLLENFGQRALEIKLSASCKLNLYTQKCIHFYLNCHLHFISSRLFAIFKESGNIYEHFEPI